MGDRRRERVDGPEIPTGSGHRWLLPGTVLAVVGLVAAAILRVPPEAALYERIAVAVFPFEQPGVVGDSLSEVVAIAIEAQLRGEPGIVTLSRAGREGETEWLRLASELGADFMVVGTIRADGGPDEPDRFEVVPHVIRTEDAKRVWSKRYTLNGLGDLSALQAVVAEEVAAALRAAENGE